MHSCARRWLRQSREGLGPDAADHANAIVPDVGNVRDCDVTVTQVSVVGLRVGRFACLSLAGSPWCSHVKMRATSKLNNAGAARSAVAGKSGSSASVQIPVDGSFSPGCADHKNVPPWMLLEGAIAISTNWELF